MRAETIIRALAVRYLKGIGGTATVTRSEADRINKFRPGDFLDAIKYDAETWTVRLPEPLGAHQPHDPIIVDLWGKIAEAVDDVGKQRRNEDFLAFGKRVVTRLEPLLRPYLT